MYHPDIKTTMATTKKLLENLYLFRLVSTSPTFNLGFNLYFQRSKIKVRDYIILVNYNILDGTTTV